VRATDKNVIVRLIARDNEAAEAIARKLLKEPFLKRFASSAMDVETSGQATS
jgi:hypothetical protein